jgi:predicted house-cleaning noncanonical NTP pyrophosphatase (MazG superfamily)
MSQLDEIMHDVINKKGPFDELMEFINETNLREIDLVMIDGIIDLLEMREKALHSLRRKIHLIKNDKYMDSMLRKRVAWDFNVQ